MVADIAFHYILGMPEECPIMPDAGHFLNRWKFCFFFVEHDYGIPGPGGLAAY